MTPACKTVSDKDKRTFFHAKSFDRAKAICAQCPVKQQCLEKELPHETASGYRWHVFGGTDPDERDELYGKLR